MEWDVVVFNATTVQLPNGVLTIQADGNYSYVPNPGFVGIETYTFTAGDNWASTTATITIEVTNSAPIAMDATQDVPYNELAHGNVMGYDMGGDTVTFTLV